MIAMEKKKLDEILKKHAAWLNNEAGGERVDLNRAYLCRADLRDANLRGAYLGGADLSEAYLGGAALREAYLRDANLHYANLHGADLYGANLSGANLSGANLDDHIVCLDRIGSAKRRTTYNATKDIVWCGCFTGTFDEWVEKIRKTYPDESNVYRKEYEAAIAYFKAVAEANREAVKSTTH